MWYFASVAIMSLSLSFSSDLHPSDTLTIPDMLAQVAGKARDQLIVIIITKEASLSDQDFWNPREILIKKTNNMAIYNHP